MTCLLSLRFSHSASVLGFIALEAETSPASPPPLNSLRPRLMATEEEEEEEAWLPWDRRCRAEESSIAMRVIHQTADNATGKYVMLTRQVNKMGRR
jgi:hypothetical protein